MCSGADCRGEITFRAVLRKGAAKPFGEERDDGDHFLSRPSKKDSDATRVKAAEEKRRGKAAQRAETVMHLILWGPN